MQNAFSGLNAMVNIFLCLSYICIKIVMEISLEKGNTFSCLYLVFGLEPAFWLSNNFDHQTVRYLTNRLFIGKT